MARPRGISKLYHRTDDENGRQKAYLRRIKALKVKNRIQEKEMANLEASKLRQDFEEKMASLEEKMAAKIEDEKQPNAWYNNNNFLAFCILMAIMVCATVYLVANNSSATMEKENDPELKHEEVQEPQTKIDENPSGWDMDFKDILIGFLILYVVLLHIAVKKGRVKIWRVLDKIRGPKQLYNPTGNRFYEFNPHVTISGDGLKLENKKETRVNVYAEKGFDISKESREEDNFTGTIIYYFEVTRTSYGPFRIGLLDGSISDSKRVGECPNSYGLPNEDFCWISGKKHAFEWPEGAIQPGRVGLSAGDVDGCGLLLSPNNKLAIFFTFNDILLGKPIPISPSVNRLYPTVTMWQSVPLEANFGDDPDKPFSFDIVKCPHLVFP